MKINKTIVLIGFILASLFDSCNPKQESEKNEIPPNGYFEYDGGMWGSIEYKIEQVVIDNCEYIIIFGSDNRNIIHKANCINDIHIYQ